MNDERETVEEHRIPIVEERVAIDKRERDGRTVALRSRTLEETLPIEEVLRDETIAVERVPVNRVVDTAPGIREEGDTIIVPVVEERIVKQLVLKEEIRLTKQANERTHRDTVTLRRNIVEIDDSAPN